MIWMILTYMGCKGCEDKNLDTSVPFDTGAIDTGPEIPEGDQDQDGDGLSPNQGDCDDGDNSVGMIDADGDGASRCNVDCDDEDPYAFPGAASQDNPQACMRDLDGDGYGEEDPTNSAVEAGTDCDDTNPHLHPGAAELESTTECMLDFDEDGYGDPDPPEGAYTAGTDCDDSDAARFPGDEDGDGFTACDGDCDDTDAQLNLDDVDGDGYTSCDGDLADDNPAIAFISPNGPSFSNILAGTFEMGSPLPEEGRDGDEVQHAVRLTRDYLIMNTEVTQGLYSLVMQVNPSVNADCGVECPVEYVSWHEAAAFANALSDQDGFNNCYICTQAGSNWSCTPDGSPYTCEGYRLPTEAEWEYAARAGTTEAYWTPLGGAEHPDIDPEVYNSGCEPITLTNGYDLSDMGWYCANTVDESEPCAIWVPNDHGLFDMYGNVAEWTHDGYEEYPTTSLSLDPSVLVGDSRVIRGGRFSSKAKGLRSADRGNVSGVARLDYVGFRLARTAPIQTEEETTEEPETAEE